MTKCFRYLFRSNAPNYGWAAVFAVGILAGCYLTGVPDDGRGLFSGYFNMFPSMLLLVAVLSGTAFCTSSLNHALSYGARRKDYFWSLQMVILVNILVYWGMNECFLRLPALLGWSSRFELVKVQPSLSFPLLLMTVHAVGCAIGKLYLSSRIAAGIITGGITSLTIILSPMFSFIERDGGNWGDLPWLLVLGALLVTFLCQFWTYGVVKTATVR